MLILMENFFYGPIPRELGECKSLTKIRIMKNQLNVFDTLATQNSVVLVMFSYVYFFFPPEGILVT
jgi:hypothetical protein